MMSTSCKDVVLCKGLNEKHESQEEYIKCLTLAGYNCMILKTLSFKFVNRDSLREYLSHPEIYCGLILTSPRSIEAIKNAINGEINDSWKKLPTYCVGPATESLGKNYLKLENCDGSQCGNAEELAKYIVEKSRSINKFLFYPCSAIARDTLPQILSTAGIKIEKLIVYETQPAETLEKDLTRIINEYPKIMVFFSPSTVDYITNAANKNSISLDKIVSVAIGPVTATALNKAGLSIHATAFKPEPNALLEAINNIVTQKKNKEQLILSN